MLHLKGVRQQRELWPPLHGPREGFVVGGGPHKGFLRDTVRACGGHARAAAQSAWAHPASFSLTIFTSNFPLPLSRGSCPVRSWRTLFLCPPFPTAENN